MTRRAKIKLPRYLRAKPFAGGGQAYFWELPSWARPPAERAGKACPIVSEPLGADLAVAIAKADRLNATLDEWRMGVKARVPEGTVKWLFNWYRTTDRFKALAKRVRHDYARAMDRICAFERKGRTFGDHRVVDVKAKHADVLYRHLQDAFGKRPAALCMQVARRAWYEHSRDEEAPNPFKRMNLDMKAAKGNRATSRAEYDTFRAKARELGEQPLATAAALSFELIRRVSDVFGYLDGDEDAGTFLPGIYWEDYIPGESIVLRQHKTGRGQTIPLAGDDGELLYAVLEEELARTARGRPDTELDGQAMTLIVQRSDGRRYTQNTARDAFNRIRDKAGLPAAMTPTGFRHGGATELGDALVEMDVQDPDLRPVTGHATRQMVDVYNKITVRKARKLATARAAFVDRLSAEG